MVTAAEGKWQSKQSGKSEMEQKTFNKFFFIFRTTDNHHNKKKYKSADHSLAYRTQSILRLEIAATQKKRFKCHV